MNKPRPAEDIALDSIKEYTAYVVKHRVLPSLDLKPVHRRILWAMIKSGARSGKGTYRKCMSIIGETLKYHPHGDKGTYAALCTLVSTPNALVGGRGNFGSVYGDRPAAPRYTESRTSELFEHLLDDVMFQIGDFIPNYDETEKEPVIFQTKLPLAPLIGVSGIGIGFTTSLPAFSLESVKSSVLAEIDGTPVMEEYAYSGIIRDNKVWPRTRVIKRDGKEWLEIYELPLGATMSITNSSPYLRELQSSKQIEIIDDSEIGKISLLICAPDYIQDMIVKSMTKPLINNFSYYWKRLRVSNFYSEWVAERRKFVERREYYMSMKIWKGELVKHCLHELSLVKDIEKHVDRIVGELYDLHVGNVVKEAKEFLGTKDDLIALVKSKPISQIQKYDYTNEKVIKLDNTDIDKIIRDEVNYIDTKLFSKPTTSGRALKFAEFSDKIVKYCAIRGGGDVEVRFRKISRVLNWEVKDEDILVIYNNCKIEKLPSNFFGLKTSEEQGVYVVGFTIAKKETVFITESDKLITLVRLSAIKEPIKCAFHAKKIKVDGKEYNVKGGLYFDKISKYEILEV